MMTIKEIRSKTGLSQSKFAAKIGVPVATLQNWEIDRVQPADYLVTMIAKLIALDEVNTTTWAFTEYRDKAGTGKSQLFKEKNEAIRFAQKEWNHLSKADQASYDQEAGDWFLVTEVPVIWDDTDQEFVPELCDFDPVWSAL